MAEAALMPAAGAAAHNQGAHAHIEAIAAAVVARSVTLSSMPPVPRPQLAPTARSNDADRVPAASLASAASAAADDTLDDSPAPAPRKRARMQAREVTPSSPAPAPRKRRRSEVSPTPPDAPAHACDDIDEDAPIGARLARARRGRDALPPASQKKARRSGGAARHLPTAALEHIVDFIPHASVLLAFARTARVFAARVARMDPEVPLMMLDAGSLTSPLTSTMHTLAVIASNAVCELCEQGGEVAMRLPWRVWAHEQCVARHTRVVEPTAAGNLGVHRLPGRIKSACAALHLGVPEFTTLQLPFHQQPRGRHHWVLDNGVVPSTWTLEGALALARTTSIAHVGEANAALTARVAADAEGMTEWVTAWRQQREEDIAAARRAAVARAVDARVAALDADMQARHMPPLEAVMERYSSEAVAALLGEFMDRTVRECSYSGEEAVRRVHEYGALLDDQTARVATIDAVLGEAGLPTAAELRDQFGVPAVDTRISAVCVLSAQQIPLATVYSAAQSLVQFVAAKHAGAARKAELAARMLERGIPSPMEVVFPLLKSVELLSTGGVVLGEDYCRDDVIHAPHNIADVLAAIERDYALFAARSRRVESLDAALASSGVAASWQAFTREWCAPHVPGQPEEAIILGSLLQYQLDVDTTVDNVVELCRDLQSNHTRRKQLLALHVQYRCGASLDTIRARLPLFAAQISAALGDVESRLPVTKTSATQAAEAITRWYLRAQALDACIIAHGFSDSLEEMLRASSATTLLTDRARTAIRNYMAVSSAIDLDFTIIDLVDSAVIWSLYRHNSVLISMESLELVFPEWASRSAELLDDIYSVTPRQPLLVVVDRITAWMKGECMSMRASALDAALGRRNAPSMAALRELLPDATWQSRVDAHTVKLFSAAAAPPAVEAVATQVAAWYDLCKARMQKLDDALAAHDMAASMLILMDEAFPSAARATVVEMYLGSHGDTHSAAYKCLAEHAWLGRMRAHNMGINSLADLRTTPAETGLSEAVATGSMSLAVAEERFMLLRHRALTEALPAHVAVPEEEVLAQLDAALKRHGTPPLHVVQAQHEAFAREMEDIVADLLTCDQRKLDDALEEAATCVAAWVWRMQQLDQRLQAHNLAGSSSELQTEPLLSLLDGTSKSMLDSYAEVPSATESGRVMRRGRPVTVFQAEPCTISLDSLIGTIARGMVLSIFAQIDVRATTWDLVRARYPAWEQAEASVVGDFYAPHSRCSPYDMMATLSRWVDGQPIPQDQPPQQPAPAEP